ncbi:hypothetical protein D3C85_829390 [compost metagenome]
MDAVGGGGLRRDPTRGDDVAEALVGGDIPLHRDRAAHAAQAIGRDRIDGQARPDDEAVRGRITAGDAQRKDIGPARLYPVRLGPAELKHGGRGDQAAQQGAAMQAGSGDDHRARFEREGRKGADRASPQDAEEGWP